MCAPTAKNKQDILFNFLLVDADLTSISTKKEFYAVLTGLCFVLHFTQAFASLRPGL